MNKSNADFLETNRDCLTEIQRADTATKANKVKGDFYRIMKEDFLPGYSYTDDCGSCLFDMVRLLYRLYDDWKAKQPAAKLFIETPEEPIEVKATFPSHKEEPDPIQQSIDYNNEMAKSTLKPNPPINNKKNHRR